MFEGNDENSKLVCTMNQSGLNATENREFVKDHATLSCATPNREERFNADGRPVRDQEG
jgi:hypothetical protein